MDYQKNQDLLFNLIKDKGVLKQDVFSNIILNFKILKGVLKEIGDDLEDKMSKVDDRVIIEYKDSGEFEAQLRVAGDLLIFQMHSNVFKFNSENSLWKTSYLSENQNRGFCGLINVYNFLNDSFKYNRSNDLGYLIGRLFINHENHFMVQGKRQLGFLYNDFINATIDKEKLKSIVQSAILYSLDFDLLVPSYDLVNQVSVNQVRQVGDDLKMRTAKRLGFVFQNNNDEI
ncbi:MAG: hypothetical protein P8Q16_08135 [Flavobacteriales bacterium]|jgi:hypothetical protein|nr:hypothetical protein [Flavobacteriales bacterium]MDG1440713.1 hypothetical protein [Flavobacteriales bacterium]MDG1797459.1 hypothetical protein [Flavobacteriales bacterium]|tara:strand:+ start:604 stop:1293 length:690 start_codon:yes stop_codon:yes gene_type:complete